jgi:alpha-mannosidase
VVCVHQFQDELPGISVAGVYLDNEADYACVERLLNDTLDASLAEIAVRLDTRREGWKAGSVPLVAYNPLAWARSEPVRVYNLWLQAPYWHAEVGFLARDVPSLGYRIFWAEPAAWTESAENLAPRGSESPGDRDPGALAVRTGSACGR